MFVVGTPEERGADPAGMDTNPRWKDVTRTYPPRTSPSRAAVEELPQHLHRGGPACAPRPRCPGGDDVGGVGAG